MRRPDRGRRRQVTFIALVTVVFLVVNTSVARAADGDGTGGDLLAPLNIRTSEGVPLQGYELTARSGSLLALDTQACALVLGGLFTLIVLLVGLACWAVEFAFRFPLLNLLADPAQEASDAYEKAIVDTLGRQVVAAVGIAILEHRLLPATVEAVQRTARTLDGNLQRLSRQPR